MPWRKVSLMDQRKELILLLQQADVNRRELFRRFGIPNASPAPGTGQGPFGKSTRCVFVDDDNDGERIAYLIW